MDLSSLFGGGGDNTTAFNNLATALNGGIGVYGAMQGRNTANQVNNTVQQGITQNTAATQAQIDALSQQIAQNRQQAQDMYQRSLTDVTGQNNELEGNIGTLTSSLNALSDPNSAYMQQARQAIERKDAAAGRNSQWGDREVQLAGTLADYVGKYSPGLQQSITGARNQINLNNQGLANLYSTANAPADRNTIAQMTALQQQLSNIQAANTTGRNAANAATNSLTGTGGVAQNLTGLIKGLGGLFGGGTDSIGNPLSNYFQGQASQENGITGYGSGLTNSYGFGGAGSLYDNGATTGYGALPAGDYFGGGGLGGTMMDYSGGFGSGAPAWGSTYDEYPE